MRLAALGDSLCAVAQRNQSPQDRARRDTTVGAVLATSAYAGRVDELLHLYALAQILRIEQRRPPPPTRACTLAAVLAALAREAEGAHVVADGDEPPPEVLDLSDEDV